MKNVLRKELLAVVIFTAGCLLDHATTAYGVALPGVTESNSFVATLMDYGLWHIAEIFVIAFGLGAGLLSVRTGRASTMMFSTVLLAFGGILRMAVGFQNLSMILSALT